jgi:hypothetical protein
MEQLPDNWTHVGGPFYIVRTQAGLRQALKHHGKLPGEDTRGYPRTYPALVCFSNGYSGSEWVRVDAVHLNRLLEKIEHQGKPVRPPPPPPPPPAPVRTHVLVQVPASMKPTQDLGLYTKVLVKATRLDVFECLLRNEIWGLISPMQLSTKPCGDVLCKELGWPHAYAVVIDNHTVVAYVDGPIQE